MCLYHAMCSGMSMGTFTMMMRDCRLWLLREHDCIRKFRPGLHMSHDIRTCTTLGALGWRGSASSGGKIHALNDLVPCTLDSDSGLWLTLADSAST